MAVFIFNREENFLAAIGDREMKNADTNDVGTGGYGEGKNL